MITIKTEEAKSAASELGIDITEGMILMAVRDSGELLGAGVMRLFENYASLDVIKFKEQYEDFNLKYGLGKSMLNLIDLRGIKYAVSSCAELDGILKALRFKKLSEAENVDDIKDIITEDWIYCLNLEGYFNSNC